MISENVTRIDLDGFRSFLLEQLNEQKTQLSGSDQFTGTSRTAENALSISKQLKSESDLKFSYLGNERNFKFNNSVKDILENALSSLGSEDRDSTKGLINDALALITYY